MIYHIVQLKNVWHIKDLVSQLTFLNDAKRGDTLNVDLRLDAPVVMPQYLAIIVSALNNAKLNGINVHFVDPRKKRSLLGSSYASRMNFYRLLDIKYTEYFFRKNRGNDLIEITQMNICAGNDKNDINLVSRIINVLKSHYDVEESVISSLNFCLWELIDNIKNHSDSNLKYTLVVQYFPNNSEIRLCVIDNGIGIHRALTETKGSKYSNFSPKESLMRCTDNNVTDGKGAGFGLYSYKKFVQCNSGHLVVYSGSYFQEIKGSSSFVNRGAYWPGTIIYNKIKTKNKVDYKEVFGDTIPTSVSEFAESINNLW